MKAILLTLLSFVYAVPAVTIQGYKPAPIYTESGYYSLVIEGQRVPVHAFDGYAYAHFSFGGGPAKMTIKAKQMSSITTFSTSPRRHGFDDSGVVSGNTLTITMKEPVYIIIYIKNSKRQLIIAADPLDTAPPVSGKGVFNVVTQYGADASGKSLSTNAFMTALLAANSYGKGSIVYVPPGVYPIGNLVLPSFISLYLAPGSVLRFTGNRADYTKHWHKNSQNLDGTEWIRTAHKSRDIKVFGRGTIDANGLVAQKKTKFIAHAVVPLNTTNFVFDGPVIRDGGSWTLMPTRSSYVTIDHAKVLNRMNLGENDAIDVQESQHVVVRNSIGIALDDAFSTKTWPENVEITVAYPGPAQPLYNVTFSNCLAWTHCYGFKVGQGVWQEQRNIRFEWSTVYDAAVGLGVHHKWGSAIAHEVQFTEMSIDNLHGSNDGHQAWLEVFVQEGTKGIYGPIDDVALWNIAVRARGGSAVWTRGVPGAPVSNVAFKNIWFKDLNRAARSLNELGITETSYSSGVLLKT
ncbi:hypothetical protein Hypma_008590 [Hypsizygus marmoreus]|uniref:Rhamnogalacturonase A/B/Epimerase-like pectate lyase domain-containing protein n=1 Tax=Hypsizygus marmoreus TaxID=39966 RepID=A0A369JUL2_HYPMA|nr:hypothetical protein Hypma_008590 [Hypsizygus marmoreus]